MANLIVKDGDGNTKYIKATGAGTDVDPLVLERVALNGGINIKSALTVTNGVYTIGDVVGGLITFTSAVRQNGGKSILNSLRLFGVNEIAYELWILDADLATPVSDNGVFTFVAADGAKVQGVVPIVAIDYLNPMPEASWAAATVRGIGLQCMATSGVSNLYGYLKATAATSPGTTSLNLLSAWEYIS